MKNKTEPDPLWLAAYTEAADDFGCVVGGGGEMMAEKTVVLSRLINNFFTYWVKMNRMPRFS